MASKKIYLATNISTKVEMKNIFTSEGRQKATS